MTTLTFTDLETGLAWAMTVSDQARCRAVQYRNHPRPPYGKRSETFARQCVFAGTTNDDEEEQ